MEPMKIIYNCNRCDNSLPTGSMHIIRGRILCDACEAELVKWLTTKITRTVQSEQR